MGKYLYLDTRECKACGACVEVCPEVFIMDPEIGYAQVRDCETYPEDKIDEAIILCPGRCITWDEVSDEQFFCEKYTEKMSEPVCKHPKDYCKFRSSCPVAFLEKET